MNFTAGCSIKESKEIQVSKENVVSTVSNKKTHNTLQPSEYSFDTALSKGYVIRKSTDDSEKDEIYNKDFLDEFIDGVKYFFTDDTHDEIQLLSFSKSGIKTNK